MSAQSDTNPAMYPPSIRDGDRPEPNLWLSSASALAVFLLVILASSCRGGVSELPVSSPMPSPSPTLLFSAIPTLAASAAVEPTNTPISIVTSTPEPSRTPQLPTPALPLTLIPTTPDTLWEACEDGPLSDLHVGDLAYLSYEPYLPTRIRTQPSLIRSRVLGLVIPGEVVEILEGPACVDQAVWWKVRSLRKSLQGWVQEGSEEGTWLIRTEPESGALVPPPSELLCPVNDESFCVFVYGLEPLVSQGDFDEILAHTRVYACTSVEGDNPDPDDSKPERVDTNCAYWALIGQGLGGVDLVSTALIKPGWTSYASPPRKIAALLLPPYQDVQPALSPSPALLIETGDPLWDWLFFIDPSNGVWQISAFVTLSRESDMYRLLTENPIQWP